MRNDDPVNVVLQYSTYVALRMMLPECEADELDDCACDLWRGIEDPLYVVAFLVVGEESK